MSDEGNLCAAQNDICTYVDTSQSPYPNDEIAFILHGK